MEEEQKRPVGRPKINPDIVPPRETLTPVEALDKLADDSSFRLQAEKLLRMVGANKMHIDFGRFNVTIELSKEA